MGLKRVAVLAGGDSAKDACRALEACGALEIYVVFSGPRSELHRHTPESWFSRPGVHAMMNWQPLGYECDGEGREHDFPVVQVIVPGYSDVLPFHPADSCALLKKWNRTDVLESYQNPNQ